ncbi:MAG: DNA mismatch repair endonuclease MutL [Deltaproteobacteria bacterium]|nr:DNA mismatch repair endonuclease MutL [Deltaproteobacteria bacterium]
MSGSIVLLPDELIGKIAAGEVIERPASIVKELIENALDAGATDITVEMEKGGCEALRVTDNGSGIDPADAALAFERYATSKIYHFDDIYRVTSFGFRGEALPSIAAVTHTTLTTRKVENLSGVTIAVEAGVVTESREVGCPVGTSVSVSHIFANVPVRRKFLKSEKVEQGHCLDVITRIALAHPAVRLRVLTGGREILNLPAVSDSRQRIGLLLGGDFSDRMVLLQGNRGEMRIGGYCSQPELTRSGARQLFFYVNRRYIRDALLSHAVMTAYRQLIPARRFPAAALFLDMPSGDVDVNVHPAKMEVRFRHPREVYELVAGSLGRALSGLSPVSGLPEPDVFRGMSKTHAVRMEEALKRYTLQSESGKLSFDREKTEGGKDRFGKVDYADGVSPPVFSEKIETVDFADLDYLGQVDHTYLVFSSPKGLMMMDQHAAHERILFEKLRAASEAPSGRVACQSLLIPEVVSLTPREMALFEEFVDLFKDAGLEVEPFGGDTVVVKAVPAILDRTEPAILLSDLISDLSEAGRPASLSERRDRLFTFLACRGAVKAGHSLSAMEVKRLCQDLAGTPHPQSCPHGRPVWITLGLPELEKMFGRR